YDYPKADYATREKIVADHVSYQKGLLWTLANSRRVPEAVRKEFQKLGMAKDEFVENDNWPTQLYVREARRMIGPYVMTELNCRGKTVAEDSIGMGAYGMDSHNCQRYASAGGHVQTRATCKWAVSNRIQSVTELSFRSKRSARTCSCQFAFPVPTLHTG